MTVSCTRSSSTCGNWARTATYALATTSPSPTSPPGGRPGYDGVLISPGPGAPEDAGVSVPLVRECERLRLPLLGVCLGHQALAVAYGAAVGRAAEPIHGRTSPIRHDRKGVFAGLPSPVNMTRYHSLVVRPETVPDVLEVSATTPDGEIMGLRHRSAPVEGIQFHPESVLSEHGHRMLRNWLDRIV